MNSKERVLATLRGATADRVPLNVFAGWNPGVRTRVEQKYGSLEGFNARHHIDIVTGVLPRFPFGRPQSSAALPDLDTFLAMQPADPTTPHFLREPCDGDLFLTVEQALAHGGDKAKFVHAWGVFELSQFLFERGGRPGTEQALLNMVLEQEKTKALYLRLAQWSAAAVENAIRAGADVVELSDDWGQQHSLLFSPQLWWEMVYPATRIIVDAARRHGVPVLLHSDGDVTQILDGIKQLGLNGLHPVQESAGMSFPHVRKVLGTDFCLMGGLDVAVLPRLKMQEIRREVRRVFSLAKGTGPFIFAGSHMFQDDAPLAVIIAAYDEAYALAEFGAD